MPILIGVVVAGFAIGAGVSVLTQRGRTIDNTTVVLASPAPEATSRPQRKTTPEPTLVPLATPRPQRTVAQAIGTPHPLRPAATVVAMATSAIVTPQPAQPKANPVRITARPAIAPRIVVTAVPQRVAVASTARPTPPVTPRPLATASAVPDVPDDADSAFARLSAGAVRTYLNALARGDDATAQALIAARPNSHAGALSEKAFADSSMRITGLDAHGTPDDGAMVNVDITTAKGNYFARFTLRRNNNGAAVIVDHDFIKP
ncbi:MAG: hypothetical protein GIW95_12505 [Candidatus Eremiobacteraeota bacterium]|nr:hypothetical protein [Candidatus Eremiobacteraeota bacterium]